MVEQKFGNISSNTADLLEALKTEINNNPFEKGEGHCSAVLKAVPYEGDDQESRENGDEGYFSVVLGSRNYNYGSESLVVGGNEINYGSNSFLSGYRGTIGKAGDTQEEGKHVENAAIVGGYRNLIKFGNRSVITGGRNNYNYTGQSNIIAGDYNTIGDKDATEDAGTSHNAVFGYGNKTTAQHGLIAGESNVISNGHSAVVGYHNKTSHGDQFVCGKWNEDETNSHFIVGCGGSEGSRANCFTAGVSDGTAFIKVGSTSLTETQLIAILESISG